MNKLQSIYSSISVFLLLPLVICARPYTLEAIRENLIGLKAEYPVWSPDGKQIAFVASQDGNYDLWVMNSDGTNLEKLFDISDRDLLRSAKPKWSPGGKLIALVSPRDGNDDIWVISTNGSGAINLTGSNKWPDKDPCWSPDGKYIAYIAITDASTEIWTVEPNGSLPMKQVSVSDYNIFDLSWSPNSDQIAFGAYNLDDETFAGLWLLEMSSSTFLALTYDRYDFSPQWSPDGSTLLMTNRDTTETPFYTEVWKLNKEGVNLLNLTEGTRGTGAQAEWSPDGERIAFVSSWADEVDIWVMDANGLNSENLTSDISGEAYFPSWSPDGSEIAFSSNEAESFDIWVMQPNGTNKVNLTNKLLLQLLLG